MLFNLIKEYKARISGFGQKMKFSDSKIVQNIAKWKRK